MANITKNFHIIHMTDDVVALDAWYDEVFSVVRFMDQQYAEPLQRIGSLVLIGDLCIEPMQPAFEADGWEQYPLGRFYNRFGKRWHSVAWFVESDDDMRELYRTFADNEIRMLSGRGEMSDTDPPPGALFTHPKDTYTQLEFMKQPPPNGGPPGMRLFDPRFHGSFDPGWWARHHPLHIRKSAATTIAVRDLDAARNLYVDVIGGTLLHQTERALTGTRSAFVAVGDDLVIELAEPLDSDSPVAADLARHGEGLHAVSFVVADLDAARSHLRSKGVEVATGNATTFTTEPDTTQGVTFGFTTADIPNDTRPDWA